VHCYAWDATECISSTQKYIELAKTWKAEGVWVTEFAFWTCGYRTQTQAGEQMRQFVQWMENEPLVMRYAWFTNRMYGTEVWAFSPQCNTALVGFDGTPTSFGTLYQSLGAN
jgi:hypothetical protein